MSRHPNQKGEAWIAEGDKGGEKEMEKGMAYAHPLAILRQIKFNLNWGVNFYHHANKNKTAQAADTTQWMEKRVACQNRPWGYRGYRGGVRMYGCAGESIAPLSASSYT